MSFCGNCGTQIPENANVCPGCGTPVNNKAAKIVKEKQNYSNVQSNQVEAKRDSYFDGGLFQLIGWHLLGILVTVATLGICYPWSFCMVYSWEAKHTVVNGHRLKFTGSAIGLFGNWIKWLLLSIITFGIYGFWVGIKLKKWKVAHTEFAN